MAFLMARASERPCATTATPSIPSSGAPPNSRQSMLLRSRRTPSRMRMPPSLPCTVRGISSRKLRKRNSAVASAIFDRDVADEAVGTNPVHLPAVETLRLDVTHEAFHGAFQPAGRLLDELVPLPFLLAVAEQADARLGSAHHLARVDGAHERELHHVLGFGVNVGADVEEIGEPILDGHDRAQ